MASLNTVRRLTLSLAAAAGMVAGSAAADDQFQKLEEQLKQSQSQVEALTERLNKLESSSGGGENADHAERLDALEELFFGLDERVGDRALVRSFDAQKVDFGGFITQQYTVAVGEDESEDSFNATQLELLIGADVTDNLSFFATLGILFESDLDFSNPQAPFFRDFALRTPLIIGWANYRHSEELELRVGRFITPHGIINIEHFPPVLLQLQQPQFLRPFGGNSIFPNFLNGIQAHGKFFLGKDNDYILSYNAYAGSLSAPDSAANTHAGVRAQLKLADSGFTLGANYARGRRGGGAATTLASPTGNFSSTPAGSITTNDYDLVGVDVLYDKGAILWKTELFYTNEIDEDDRVGFYTQPAYRFNDKWLAFYRFDYFDPGQGIGDSTENVVGVNYLPHPTVRIRGEAIFRHENGSAGRGTTDADTLIFQLSATFSF